MAPTLLQVDFVHLIKVELTAPTVPPKNPLKHAEHPKRGRPPLPQWMRKIFTGGTKKETQLIMTNMADGK